MTTPSDTAIQAAREAIQGETDASHRFVLAWLNGDEEEAVRILAGIIHQAYEADTNQP